MGRKPHIYPHLNLFKNLAEVRRLLEIHEEAAGTGPGYKHNVEVLNKSAIVLLVACWESFVEDLGEDAFSILLRRAKKHSSIPQKVLGEAGKSLKESANPCDIWQLAGDGWKKILASYKVTLFERYTGKLNTPRPSQVDALYGTLLGIKAVSASWHWQSMTPYQAVAKMNKLVDLRGSIAHRVAATGKVRMEHVRAYISFVNRVAVQTSNTVREFLMKNTGKEPWPEFWYQEIRKG